MSLRERVRSGWNAFMNKDPTYERPAEISYYYRPDRTRQFVSNERSVLNSVFNRIAVDCAQCDIKHIKLDENDRYQETIKDELNECLTVSANIDQTGRAMLQDFFMSILDEGCAACVPVEADYDPDDTDSYKIYQLRVGKIIKWMPTKVQVKLYNEKTGKQQDVVVSKNYTAIVENPFYSVMNEKNSTAQRLRRKLSLLDAIDERNSSGKLDLIIQLPYVIKTPAQKVMAENRRKDIEMQLTNSKYGIAYTDGTEHVVQLNRAIDNQLVQQVKDLRTDLLNELGMTAEILNGTAEESTYNNYYNGICEPLLTATVEEMRRKYLSPTARTRQQSIEFFRTPFKLVPTSQLAEMADKFTRNEIMTSNEVRQVVGLKPSLDPHADELRNSNLSAPKDTQRVDVNGNVITESGSGDNSQYEEGRNQNGR